LRLGGASEALQKPISPHTRKRIAGGSSQHPAARTASQQLITTASWLLGGGVGVGLQRVPLGARAALLVVPVVAARVDVVGLRRKLESRLELPVQLKLRREREVAHCVVDHLERVVPRRERVAQHVFKPVTVLYAPREGGLLDVVRTVGPVAFVREEGGRQPLK